MNNRLIKSNNAGGGGGGGCTDIVDNYDPFGDSSGVALYQLNGNANDVSGVNNGFSVTGITWGSPGVFGSSSSFPGGTSAKIGFPDIINSHSTTISAWVKGSGYWCTPQKEIYAPLGTSSLYWGASGTDATLTGVEDGNWHHIAVCATSARTVDYYVDGVQVAHNVSATDFPQNYNYSDNWIGHFYHPATPQSFNGLIDQFRIFNRGLTSLEVEALYTEELCICGGTVDTVNIFNDNSCIALYPLDGNANDLSGNYSGTPTNVSYGVGEFDLAGVFNGSSSVVTLPSALSDGVTTDATCISFWFNVGSEITSATPNNEIMNFAQSSSNFGKIAIGSTTGNFGGETFSVTSDVTSQYTYMTANIPAGWNHAVVQWNNSTTKWDIYINAVFQVTNTFGTNEQGKWALKFGNRSSFYYNGSLDQVRIFNKALSAGEVTTLYNETACTYVPDYDPITEGATNPFGDGSEYALYKFDGNVTDSEGSYNGLVSGSVSYTTGLFGQAVNLTGTNASVEIPNFSTSDFSNKNVSVSCWVNMQSLASGASSKGAHLFTVGSGSWAVSVSQIGISFAKYLNGSNNYLLKDTTPVNLNQWYHIVATDSTSTGMKIYVNGVIVASVNYTGAIDLTYNDIGWGYYNDYQDRRGFTGYIDQGRVFNKTLSASEVYALYNE